MARVKIITSLRNMLLFIMLEIDFIYSDYKINDIKTVGKFITDISRRMQNYYF